MAFWTILGKGNEGEAESRVFAVMLDTDKSTWTAGGGSVDLFFVTKSGEYKVAVLPEQGTQLVSPSGAETAFFKALTGASAVGSKGTGRASEKGVTFSWTLDSK